MLRSRFIKLFVWLAVLTSIVQAGEYVLVLPGAGGTSSQIPVFGANPFTVQSTITGAAPGAFTVLTTPDGQKNYIISNTGSTAVSVYDQNFSNGRTISGSISLAPVAAALSPDGRRLVVLAGNIYIFDTGTDTLLSGSGVQVNGTLVDVAFAVDSSKAYVLANSGQTGVITPIDLSTNIAGTPLTLAGNGAGIATGPTGFLYVTTPNRLFEINPRTLSITPSGEIPVNANPSKPVFTPDGKYALAINRTPITGSSVLLFDLGTHTLAGAFPNFAVTLDKLLVAGNNRIFAYSSQNNNLYEVTVQSGLNINPSSLLSILPSQIGQFALSNEVPARSLYILAVNQGSNNLYKVDLPTTNIVGQFLVSNAAGQQVAYANANPTSGGATVTAYNAAQVVQPGAISLPLVARVQDAAGRPVFGARVDFTTTVAGAVINPASAFTNSSGFAQTFVTAPTAPGPVTVTAASAGATSATYSLTVPGSGGGGGGGGTSLASIVIDSGNGQVIPEQFLATQPLTVKVLDANGNPAPNVPVTFTITQGKGTILGGISTAVTTDINGKASTTFLASNVDPGFSFQQATVNAATSVGSVNFTITTVLTTLPNGGPAQAPAAYLLKPDLATGGRLIKGGAGEIIKDAIRVQMVITAGAQQGQVIPNVSLTVGPAPDPDEDPAKIPTASCVNNPLTDATGVVSCDLKMGNILGIHAVSVNVGGLVNTAQVLVQVTVGPPANIAKTNGDAQSGKPGDRLPQSLRVRVTDSAGNPLNNVPLKWEVTSGSGTFSNTNNTTDVNGSGQTNLTLGSTPGNVTVKVTAGTGAQAVSTTFTALINVNVSGITVVSGDAQVVSPSQAFPQLLTILVTDDKGAPLPNIPVTWAVASGAASLGQTSNSTDATGRASISANAGATPGPVVVTATVGSNLTATFNLSIRQPGPPVVSSSFVNAASGAAGLAPCGVAIVQAAGLAPSISGTIVANTLFGPLPTTLGGVDLTVNGIAAPIYWATSSAVAFQTPCETQAGPASVTVRVNGATTTVQGVTVAAVQPGVFESVYNGRKYAVLVRANGSYVTPDNPAKRGEQVTLFATGLGQVTPGTVTGAIGVGGQAVSAPITVGVNNSGVRVVSSEYLRGNVGLYIVTFEVPADTQAGPYQNLALALAAPDGSQVFANGTFFPIQ